MAPFYPVGDVSTCAAVFIFRIKSSLLIRGVTPVVPAFRSNMFIHGATQEYSFCIAAPGPAQVYFGNATVGGQLAIHKHIPELFALGSAGGSYKRVAFAVYFAVLENRCGRTENEIGCTFNIA